jgi:hypothetical protein
MRTGQLAASVATVQQSEIRELISNTATLATALRFLQLAIMTETPFVATQMFLVAKLVQETSNLIVCCLVDLLLGTRFVFIGIFIVNSLGSIIVLGNKPAVAKLFIHFFIGTIGKNRR